jgi:hypothetical protein
MARRVRLALGALQRCNSQISRFVAISGLFSPVDGRAVSWVGTKVWGAVVCAALAALSSSAAIALELVPGGYGATPAEPTPSRGEPLDVGGRASAPALALDFTPRGGSALWSKSGDDVAEGPGLRFDLTVRGGSPDPVDRFGIGTSHEAWRASTYSSPGALTVGGAMRWSDWSLGGGVGRAQVLGEDVDLMAATLGYGRVKAEIAYGQSEASAGPPQDVLMLSTDLAASPWLTLESELALGSRNGGVDGDRARDREPAATGRFGLRLNF